MRRASGATQARCSSTASPAARRLRREPSSAERGAPRRMPSQRPSRRPASASIPPTFAGAWSSDCVPRAAIVGRTCSRRSARCRATGSSMPRWRPGLRGHQPADRPRADDLQAFGRGPHAGDAIRRRACARLAAASARVLEIGTGCGYQAALLCEVSRSESISVERLKPMHDKARKLLGPMRSTGFGSCSATACSATRRCALRERSSPRPAATTLPQAWLEQLAIGGQLVVAGGSSRQRCAGAGCRRSDARPALPAPSTRR